MYTGKRNSAGGSGLINHNGLDYLNSNPFYSKATIPLLTKHKGTGGTLLNGNKECQSLKILLSSNYSRISPFNALKYNTNIGANQSIQADPVTPIRNCLGPLGTVVLKIANFYSSKCNRLLREKTRFFRQGFLKVMKPEWLTMFSNQ